MRAPDDLPRRGPRRKNGRRGRTLLIIGIIAAFILLTSLRGIAGFYTDYLWFDSLDQTGVWRGILGAKLSLALIFMAGFFLLAWSNLLIADRIAPPFRLAGPEDELLERYHDIVDDRMGWLRIVICVLLAIIAGSGVSSEWNSWVLFTHGGDFGVEDPQFHNDIGFYVFRLPFLSFVVDWLFASLLIVIIVTAVAHYLNGGIRVQPPSPRVTPQVKAHLSVLLAVLALIKTGDYWLQRFELTTSTRGIVDGASYTDVRAQLPALNLLVLISLCAAALFVVNIFRRGWTLPAVAVGLWMFVAVVAGGIYPQYVQRFQVQPNESARERPYIQRNIKATRDALGLSDVQTQRFERQKNPADVQLAGAEPTVRNIRLWDPSARLSGQTFQQLQRIRNFYNINDVDVDRYSIDGQPAQVNVGVRTINPDGVPGDSWEAAHLAYTHGYGMVMAPSNAAEGNEPQFVLGEIPQKEAKGLDLKKPGIYFGEDLDGYIVVNTNRDEIDYQDEQGETQFATYQGADGVQTNSLVRRAAFALRFGDLNPLISDFMTDNSRVVYVRDVVDRVTKLAPFLAADNDPYPVLVDGRVKWVVDLYTTTSRYPYAQMADTDQLASSSGLNHRFNYVRNSVKATVDAYDGTVTFYVMDKDDPIIEAYRDAFPDLFTDDSMPDELLAHLRYPEDIFRVQTAAYARYHLDDPDEFFNQNDAWRVARDPGTAGADPATRVTNEQGQTTGAQAPRIAPYYQLLQLPTESGEVSKQAEMVLMRSFVPFSEDDRSQLLTAFMAARMDPDHYGELVVYEMPPSDLPDGPGLAAAAIRADENVARDQTELGQRGSEVLYGNLLLVPVDNALLYVQPFYVLSEDEARQLPQLEKVIVNFGDTVVIEDTLQEALVALFGERVATQERPGTEGQPAPPGETPPPPEQGGTAADDAARLLAQANQLFAQADAALTDGDLAKFQQLLTQARALVTEANQLLRGEGGGASSGSTTTSSTTTTTEAETSPA
jgi:uncharacterized membrane protein (UPF0182 family)